MNPDSEGRYSPNPTDELLAETIEQVKKLRAEVATMRAATDELLYQLKRISASPYFASVALANDRR